MRAFESDTKLQRLRIDSMMPKLADNTGLLGIYESISQRSDTRPIRIPEHTQRCNGAGASKHPLACSDHQQHPNHLTIYYMCPIGQISTYDARSIHATLSSNCRKFDIVYPAHYKKESRYRDTSPDKPTEKRVAVRPPPERQREKCNYISSASFNRVRIRIRVH